jgi:3-hydroxyisobutyrate dehydrogenase-like beta-hydroxyacid dehydrogenase
MKLRALILGYGKMGNAMEHLLAARHDVRVWKEASSTRRLARRMD